MSELTPVGSSSRSAALAVLAMVALIGGLIGLRWLTAEGQPGPTMAAVLPSSSQPTATPPVTTTATASLTKAPEPTPSPRPTPTPLPTPEPTRPPDDRPTALRVLTTAEFQAVFASRQFVGQTLVVAGRIDPMPEVEDYDVPDVQYCDGRYACVYGELAGATTDGGTRPVLVWSSRIAAPLRPEDAAAESWWPNMTRAWLPLEGELVLRIDTPYSVEYVGRAVVDAAGDTWTAAEAAARSKAGLEIDQVLLVDGWLSQSTITVTCTTSEPLTPLPRHFCGEQAWIQATPSAAPGVDALGVQPGAYVDIAPNPRSTGGEYVPRHGLVAVGVRLEWDGCDARPCPSWTALGWVTSEPDIATVLEHAQPAAVPDGDWLELAAQDGRTAKWSPSGRWLLVSLFREVVLVDARTGTAVRHWDFEAGQYGRGAMWIDDSRFLAFNQPIHAGVVHHGLTPAVMGRIDREQLVDVEVPAAFEDAAPFVDMVASGNGAVAFNTARTGESDCGTDGCFTFRVWTPAGVSPKHAGMPIAWSPAGDRLAVIHNDHLRDRPAVGAGVVGYSGWLEVVSWPGLRTVFADRRVIFNQDTSFDPTGHLVASMSGPTRVVNLDTGRVSRVRAEMWPPVWDRRGNLVIANADGDVIAIDTSDHRVDRWTGAGHQVVGSADGATLVAMLNDSTRAPQAVGLFTIIRDASTNRFALPPQSPDALLWDQAVSPDGRAFFVWVRHYTTTNAQLLFRRLP